MATCSRSTGEGLTYPTAGEWREVYAAFADFWTMGGVVIIDGNLRGEQSYAVVTGAAGITQGLALYLGDGGLAAYRAMMSAEVNPECSTSTLMCYISSRPRTDY